MKKTLEERIEIEQAFLDGKQLEVDFGQMGHWALFGKTPNPFFNWEWHNYRIKPEPMDLELKINALEEKLDKVLQFLGRDE